MMTSIPYRSHGVEDPLRRKTKSGRCFGVAGLASIQNAAGMQQLWSSGPMNGSVHAASAQKRAIGCIYDRIHLKFGNVAAHDNQFRHTALLPPSDAILSLKANTPGANPHVSS